MVYDKYIKILHLNDDDTFKEIYSCHASINKTSSKEYLAGGSERSSSTLTFQFRYTSKLDDMQFDFEKYRIKWKNRLFYVANGDNVQFKNQKIKIIGEQINDG